MVVAGESTTLSPNLARIYHNNVVRIERASAAAWPAARRAPWDCDRRRIDIPHAIKTVGDHAISISLYRDIRAEVVVAVADVNAPVVEEAAEEPAAEEAAPAEEAAEEAAPEAVEAE